MTKQAREAYERWSETADPEDLWAAFEAGYEAAEVDHDEAMARLRQILGVGRRNPGTEAA